MKKIYTTRFGGQQVQALLKKAASLDISRICPLHGPILTENLGYYIGLYNTWSSYAPEDDGITVAVDDSMDVNMSGKLDANDAQFVYNMYNNMYSGITTDVTIEKYLRADVNGSKTVTTEDAAAVVNKIMNPNT